MLRIAFGAVLLAQVQDVRAGHELLNEYLSDLKLNSQTSADVLYRVNKPQKQLVEDREFLINRISTWTVITRQQVLIAIGGNSPVFQSPNPPIAARLEIDLNTALQSDLIGPALLAKIYSSLIEQGRTIAAEGDIE